MKGYHTYKDCIEACLRCAAICNHFASSCTQEEDVKMMARCIQLDMECVAICYAAAQLMSLGSEKAKELCRLCAEICDECGEASNRTLPGMCGNVSQVRGGMQTNGRSSSVIENAGNACIFLFIKI